MSKQNPVSPKVVASASSATAAGAAVTIAVWIAESNGIDVPAEVAAAATVLVSAIAGYIAGWLKRDPLRSTGKHSA